MSHLFIEVAVGPLVLPNRIVVAPMCQFSTPDGEAGDWHLMHLGTLALSGAGLLIIESTGVVPEGRITHADLGLWNERQQAALARTLAAVRRYSNTRIGIQLSHAGRKAAEPAPGDGVRAFAANDPRSWPVVAPSALPVSEHAPQTRALDAAGIDAVVEAFAMAAQRAVAAGVDLIELHGAHGFLLHQFLSPLSNQRTDDYGGSLENRLRLTLRVFDAVKAAVPERVAVGIRISATDWVDGGWDLTQSIALSKALDARGCAYIHVSAGGLDPARQVLPPLAPGYQLSFAAAIKAEVRMPVIGVGLITEPQQAEDALQQGQADLVALGRAMLYDPRWPWHAANVLGGRAEFPQQYFGCWPHDFGGQPRKALSA